MGKAGVGGASGLPPCFSFPFRGFPLGAKRKGSVVGGHPESLLEQADWGGVARGSRSRWLRGGRSLGTVVGGWVGQVRVGQVGGAGPRGAAGGGPGAFPFRHGQFRSFRPRSPGRFGDETAFFRRTEGDQTATGSSPFRNKFAVSSPFRAGLFFFRFIRA